MKIGYKEIVKQRKQEEMKGIYLFYGRENFLIEHILSGIEEDFSGPFSALNIHRLSGENLIWDDFFNACETLPMMESKKLVVVEDFPLSKEAIGKKKELVEEMVKYLPRIGDHAVLIFTSKEEKAFAGKFYKVIEQLGTVCDFEKLSQNELTSFVRTLIKQEKKNIENQVLNTLVFQLDYLDRDSEKKLFDVKNNVEVLCRYLGGRTEIKGEDVEEVLISPGKRNIFDLLDALTLGNAQKALTSYEILRKQKEEWTMIFYMMLRQVRNLIKVKSIKEKGYTKQKGIVAAGISPYEYGKLYTKVDGISYQRLLFWHKKLYEWEFRWKKVSVREDLGMEMLITEICAKK